MQIDTSDIAPLTEQFWKTAIRNPFHRPVKQATTVRIDADVLQWLKSNGTWVAEYRSEAIVSALPRLLHHPTRSTTKPATLRV